MSGYLIHFTIATAADSWIFLLLYAKCLHFEFVNSVPLLFFGGFFLSRRQVLREI